MKSYDISEPPVSPGPDELTREVPPRQRDATPGAWLGRILVILFGAAVGWGLAIIIGLFIGLIPFAC